MTRRTGRRRRRITIGVAIAVVAALGAAQLAFGWVNRVIDATGWTCGGGWSHIDGEELAEMRVLRWGTPEVRDQGVDPEEFADLPPGLAEPTLTTPGIVESGVYDPLLYPLGEGVVLQGAGYTERSWVGADARTGEPLWGIDDDTSGFSTLQGRFSLVAARDDGRTDLSTFEPRTGERLSCVRLDGAVTAMTEVGDNDIAVALRTGDGDEAATWLLRLDPVTGDERWRQALELAAVSIDSDGQVVSVSSTSVGSVSTSWVDQGHTRVVTLDASDGHEIGPIQPSEGQWTAADALTMPDGSSTTLLYGFTDRVAWSEGRATYALVDAGGSEVWRVESTKEQDELAAWVADGVVVVLDGWGLAGIDLVSGERLWSTEGVSTRLQGVALLQVEGTASLLVTDQRDEDAGETTFVSLVIDPATGDTETYDAALRDATVTDSYLLTSSGMTQIVIPLAE